jgi:hypothetical protein
VSIYNVKKNFQGLRPRTPKDRERTDGKGGDGREGKEGRERKGRERNKGKETAILCPRKKKLKSAPMLLKTEQHKTVLK